MTGKKNRFITLMSAFICFATAAFAAEDWNLRVFVPDVDQYDRTNVYVRAAEKYQKETGGKVTFVNGTEAGGEVILLNNRQADTPLDVVYIKDSDFIRYVEMGYIQQNSWYVNFSNLLVDREFVYNQYASENVFRFNEGSYATSEKYATNAYVVVYNKTFMMRQGIASSVTPDMLKIRNQWDWEHLESYAQKLTKTTGAKSIGLGCIDPQIFVYMNGGNYIARDPSGNTTLRFSDAKTKEALQFISHGVNAGWLTTNSESIFQGFKNREIGMVICLDKDVPKLLEGCQDTIEYVALPKGPSADDYQNITQTTGFAITKDSTKQTAAGRLIEYLLRETYERDRALRNSWPQGLKDVVGSIIEEPLPIQYPIANLSSIIESIMDDIIYNFDAPLTAIAKNQRRANTIINHEKDAIESVPMGFRGVVQNFDRISDRDEYVLPYMNTSSAEVSIIKGAEAIRGRSLKISYNPDADGNGAYVALTDSIKLGLVGFRNYIVNFDVKVSNINTNNACVYMVAYSDSNYQFGKVVQYVTEEGTVYHVTGELSGITRSGRVSLLFGLSGVDSAVIDNIVINEK